MYAPGEGMQRGPTGWPRASGQPRTAAKAAELKHGQRRFSRQAHHVSRASCRASASGPLSIAWRASTAWPAGCSTLRRRGDRGRGPGRRAGRASLRDLRDAGPASGAHRGRRGGGRAAVAGDRRLRDPAERSREGESTSSSRPTSPPAPTACASCSIPRDRRYRYPFTNCTNCGPRFTIIEERALRPPQHDHARLPHVPGVPARVRRPARPALPCPAQRLPGLRAPPGAGATRGGQTCRRPRRRVCAERAARAAAPGQDPGAQGAGRLSAGLRRHQRRPRWPRCASASAARTSPSR